MAPQPTSSTSNSRRSLVLVFALALLLLAAYAVGIQLGWVPATDGFQVRDKNRIKSERFFLEPPDRLQTVLVGSSLTANLPTQEVSAKVYNLGLAGESVWTGLDLVQKRSDTRPRRVVLEASDLLLRESDHQFVKDITGPFHLRLRKVLPMFRAEYQPAAVFLKAVGRWQKRRNASAGTPKFSGILPVTQRLIDQARAKDAAGLSAHEARRMREACERLRTHMAALEAEGVRCILLQVPGDSSLEDTPRNRQLADLLSEQFPAPQFAWIRPEQGFKGTSWDAVHLVQEDASSYAHYLCQQLER